MDLRKVRMGLAAALFVCALPLATAQAQNEPDPEQVAKKCIERVNKLSEGTVKQISEVCDKAVAKINELQAAGDQEGARRAAHRGLEAVVRIADRGHDGIRKTTEHAVKVLKKLEAPKELIEQVLANSKSAQGAIREAARKCAEAIKAALKD